jgi:hypothetical protein
MNTKPATEEKPKTFSIRRTLPHIIAIAIFAILSMLYFKPAYEGKTLQQSDMTQWNAMSQELREYSKNNPGARSAWSGTMFSGMPSYNFGTIGDPPNYTAYIQQLFYLGDSGGAGPVFASLVSAYILFFLLTGNFIISLIGAIACSFTSYNIVILQAGHVTKAWAIAFMPAVLAGMLLVFRKKFIPGSALLTLALTLELGANHIQITYYLAITCIIIFLAWLAKSIRKKEYKTIAKSAAIMIVALILAVSPRLAEMYSNLEMSRTSLRGPSELTAPAGNDSKSNAKTSTGLDRDYAFTWSYGRGETLSLLIPNIHGGESGGTLGKNSNLAQALKNNGQRTSSEIRTYTYWGDKPFTSGPVYAGAVVCFLFVLGMFIIPGRFKWWLFGAAALFVMLSWGKNLAPFNDFLFYNLPMYNKFRTPEMSLVITTLILPIIAVWGLKTLLTGNIPADKLKKQYLLSIAITGGLCLLLRLMPGLFFNFQSEYDHQFSTQVPDWYYTALIADRCAILQSDAMRSLIFTILAAATVYILITKKQKYTTHALTLLAILTFADLWTIDKRYLNHANFEKTKTEQTFQPTPADKIILEDKTPSYRVLNLTVNTFNDATTSYYHKSVGGYSPAKLRRYQELIDARLTPEIQQINQSLQPAETIEQLHTLAVRLFTQTPTLNMLNTKYIIYKGVPIQNPHALGNAWFVQEIRTVDTPDLELQALNHIDPRATAVVDRRFAGNLPPDTIIPPDPAAPLTLTQYRPEHLTYHTTATTPQTAVFSEIYYTPGWKTYIDRQPAPHYRVNWTLRAMNIPAGEHTIEFHFQPDTYNTLASAGTLASIIILILLLAALVHTIRKP